MKLFGMFSGNFRLASECILPIGSDRLVSD